MYIAKRFSKCNANCRQRYCRRMYIYDTHISRDLFPLPILSPSYIYALTEYQFATRKTVLLFTLNLLMKLNTFSLAAVKEQYIELDSFQVVLMSINILEHIHKCLDVLLYSSLASVLFQKESFSFLIYTAFQLLASVLSQKEIFSFKKHKTLLCSWSFLFTIMCSGNEGDDLLCLSTLFSNSSGTLHKNTKHILLNVYPVSITNTMDNQTKRPNSALLFHVAASRIMQAKNL